jgi:N,N-dimethylformamidase
MSRRLPLLGYVDRLAVAAGEQVAAFVHSPEHPCAVRTLRLFGDDHRVRRDEPAPPVAGGFSTVIPSQSQSLTMGSFATAGLDTAVSTCALWIFPTALGEGSQTVLQVRDDAGEWRLDIDHAGHLCIVVDGADVIRLSGALPAKRWSGAAVHVGTDGRCTLNLRSGRYWGGGVNESASVNLAPRRVSSHCQVSLAAAVRDGVAGQHFDGKIDSPVLAHGAFTSADLDRLIDDPETLGAALAVRLGVALDLRQWPDRSNSNRNFVLHHGPTVAVAGHRGPPGRSGDADQLSAVHFHSDDVLDQHWTPSFTWAVPDDLPSGAYAFELTSGEERDIVPFIVTPRRRHRSVNDVAVVLPTMTWLAYANRASWLAELDLPEDERPKRLIIDWETKRSSFRPSDQLLLDHPGCGRGCYDRHADGSSVVFSSISRPLISLKPDAVYLNSGAGRDFSGNLYLLDWLDRSGITVDVLTDHDVHHNGATLDGYSVVIHPGHPEYATPELLDGLERYLNTGGNLMVLGGNCYYIVCGVLDDGWTVEVRRPMNNWYERGSTRLVSNGISAHLWEECGRFPSAISGTVSLAEGHPREEYAGYRWSAEVNAPALAFVTKGAGEGSVFGRYGLAGGAAGDETDGLHPAYPQPDGLVVVASSHGEHGAAVRPFLYDFIHDGPPPHGPDHPDVKADIVLYRHPGGGRVFSVGSINWCASLLDHAGENDVARVTRNVLDEFRRAGRRDAISTDCLE